jgi:hypothetical protein
MKYNHEDKKTGLGLSRDVSAEQYAEPGDIKVNYMLTLNGDVLLENRDGKELAQDIYNMIARLRTVYNFLMTKNEPKYFLDNRHKKR